MRVSPRCIDLVCSTASPDYSLNSPARGSSLLSRSRFRRTRLAGALSVDGEGEVVAALKARAISASSLSWLWVSGRSICLGVEIRLLLTCITPILTHLDHSGYNKGIPIQADQTVKYLRRACFLCLYVLCIFCLVAGSSRTAKNELSICR